METKEIKNEVYVVIQFNYLNGQMASSFVVCVYNSKEQAANYLNESAEEYKNYGYKVEEYDNFIDVPSNFGNGLTRLGYTKSELR